MRLRTPKTLETAELGNAASKPTKKRSPNRGTLEPRPTGRATMTPRRYRRTPGQPFSGKICPGLPLPR
eukprot:5462305-Pyramimonas_sp.AAC.1